MAKHTIQSIGNDLKEVKGDISEMKPKVNTLWDWMNTSKGEAAGKALTSAKRDGTISITPEIWKLIMALVGIIAAFIGGSKLS